MLKKIVITTGIFCISWLVATGLMGMIVSTQYDANSGKEFLNNLDVYTGLLYPLLYALVVAIINVFIHKGENRNLKYFFNLFIGWEIGFSVIFIICRILGYGIWEINLIIPIIGGVIFVLLYKKFQQIKANKEDGE